MLVSFKLLKKKKRINKHVTEENDKSYFEYIYKPKKIESYLTNFNAYDHETLNTDRAKPYNMTFHRLDKIAGR